MVLSKNYNPNELEDKWAVKWDEEGTYKFDNKSKKPVYSIDTPPPFTSGYLHMGHILSHSYIDVMARYKRMTGYSVNFPQGFDCHGLPTEMKVEKEFRISPHNREAFLSKCREWTLDCIKKMKEQFKALGYSADWNHEYHTMDDDYLRLVQDSLIKFYDKDLLYRAKHPIMWCHRCETALAKAEVGYVDKKGKLYELKLPLVGGGSINIATTRPEFISACVAVLVHPDDVKYLKIAGKKVRLPIYEREVPVIADKDVDKEYGTGAVYLCTFGDEQDLLWQKRHKLPVIEVIEDNGTMKNAGILNGLKISEARVKIVEELKNLKVIINEKEIEHRVLSHTERGSCLTPIELISQTQWFIKVKDSREEIISNAKKVKCHPENLVMRLIDWAKSMDWDWIVSRQRVFGTPIPFWVCKKCGKVIPAGVKELPINPAGTKKKCSCGGEAYGETDVCDCWIDSSVTPLKVSRWGEDEGFFKKTYPTSLRPQGYEIIRTWMFYTLFRCYKLTGEIPWTDALFNGMVGGTDGRKMSKSYGNIVSPEEAISKYGADTMRQWGLISAIGEDYPLSWEEMEYSRKFMNKLWNIAKFIESVMSKKGGAKPNYNASDEWINNELNKVIKKTRENFEAYNVYALRDIRNFVWHELADYYLEMIKYRIYGEDESSRQGAISTVIEVLRKVVLLLAPYTPFACEEIWRELFDKKSVHLQDYPEAGDINESLDSLGGLMKELISQGRQYKVSKQMSMGSELPGVVIEGSVKDLEKIQDIIQGTLRIKNVEIKESKKIEIKF